MRIHFIPTLTLGIPEFTKDEWSNNRLILYIQLEARETARRHCRPPQLNNPGLDPGPIQPRRAYTEAPKSKARLDQWRRADNIILLNEVVLIV